MLQRAITLGLRMLGREWKSGELGILLVALTVAVGALTGVGFLVNRISQSVALQANEVLAADLRLESGSAPLDAAYESEARNRGLATARTTSRGRPTLAGRCIHSSAVITEMKPPSVPP